MKKIIKVLLILTIFIVTAFTASGCGEDEKKDAPEPDLDIIMAKMKEKTELPEMMELIESDLADIYGIDSADVEKLCGGIVGDGFSPDEIVMIKAKDKAAAERVKSALEKRLQNKINEAKGYNPDAYALMQKSRVSINGVYTSMLVSYNQDTLVEIYNSFFK